MSELNIAIKLAYDAGRMIMRKHFGTKEPEIIKPDGTPKTRADVEADEIIVGGLERRFHNHSILSEEREETPSDVARRLSNPNVWIIDPLDGSNHPKNQSYDFAINIAYVRNGMPHAAVVYLPAHDKMFTAVAGDVRELPYLNCPREDNPIFRHFDQIRVSNRTLSNGFVSLSAKEFTEKPKAAEDLITKLGAKNGFVQGSRAVRMCTIAEGRADLAYVNDTIKSGIWDLCAPALIVQAAGGQVTDYDGNPIRYDVPNPKGLPRGAVISNKIVHSNAIPLLREYAPLK